MLCILDSRVGKWKCEAGIAVVVVIMLGIMANLMFEQNVYL
jgi:hypothetical protein